ncbi:MAG: PepSY domain protein [Alphaproteobacteria bacterium]|nr:PepSY domain protein [Alphaproteobacteria bacterium]
MKTFMIGFAAASLMIAPGANAMAPQPKISQQAARTKALAIVLHGKIIKSELETEKGQLLYSFDIQMPHRSGVEEVQISAVDGRLISRTHESAAKEQSEARAETKAAKHK